MQISIDTSKDSHEHIKHMIQMLQRLVGDTTNTPSSSVSDSSSAFADMFSDSAPHPVVPHTPSPGLPPPTDPLTNLQELNAPKEASPRAVDLWGNPKKEDDNPPVEVY